MSEKKREKDDKLVSADAKAAWAEKWDQPSEAPSFEGATPQALARALSRLRRNENGG